MICRLSEPKVTLKDLLTGAAAAKLALPSWEAVIVHSPAETKVIAPPEVTVQTGAVVDA